MDVLATTAAVPHALNALPTVAAVAALCVGVVVEIVAVPAVLLPGGTMTLLAGALIGAGRPALEVAVPVIAAVVAGDQVAYFSGAAVTRWWRRHRPARAAGPPGRDGRAAAWLTAAMPSLAGAAGMRHRPFAVRVLVMRVPWLATALSAGALAAHSLAGIGRAAGIVGMIASAVVLAGLLAARHRPSVMRALARRNAGTGQRLSSTMM